MVPSSLPEASNRFSWHFSTTTCRIMLQIIAIMLQIIVTSILAMNLVHTRTKNDKQYTKNGFKKINKKKMMKEKDINNT